MTDQIPQSETVIGVIEQAVNDQLASITRGGDPYLYVQAIALNASRTAARELAQLGLVNSLGPGQHAMVTADPERNHGRASISRTMVPVWAPAGQLWAGDPVEAVRDEYVLTESEAAVVSALAADFQDLAARDEPPPDEDVCRAETVTVDGREETVVVRGREPMTDLDKEMFAELVEATRAYVAEHDPHIEIRQELAAAWMGIASRVPNGPEKDRLRAAAKAAQEALGARGISGDGGLDVDIPRA